ncbi:MULTISPECIES: hypothetical protein [Burkholderia]|jgi:hypothetical protein|uniref:Uncharacterized protein n=2 Tax=Burkholderia contaminans TaxID=488447 RepID=A0A1E3FTP7_9BURK|nr:MULTISPECIES: hypothetical protein [Burkholderia]UTP25822.1 hypothetical protein NMB33_22025 [Burkholderia sp. FXe9]KKL41372.1 hypothetical protein WR31_13730 [Burkholderia contaminans LMG 23361]MBA9828538.1 hypothetical protein [Burkholderia contaminans]MBA9837526.1 hypothetical protein [Burkholderia contaminans]MBA9860372.1 hypothetical protein [Burkholderia contaminans]
MTFNTDMPFQESTVMSVDLVCECPPDDTSCAPAAIDERAATADPCAPKRRTERTDGRGRRFRFGDAVDAMSAPNDAPPRPVTGSIAISFAVVSRRNWPR